MSAKTASVLTRTEPETKAAADLLFERIGTSTSGAINIFLHKAIEEGGFPFAVKVNRPELPNIDEMSQTEVNKMLDETDEKTLKNGGKPADEVFATLDKEFAL